MNNIVNFLTELVGPAAIISVLRKQDGYALGKDLATPIETFLDTEFGDKKSELIQLELLPFLGRVLHGLKDGLEGK